MMSRTQVQFTDEQLRRVRARARRDGISVAELVRRLVASGLDAQPPDQRRARYEAAAKLVGRYRDVESATDVAARHDSYLDDAYRQGRP